VGLIVMTVSVVLRLREDRIAGGVYAKGPSPGRFSPSGIVLTMSRFQKHHLFPGSSNFDLLVPNFCPSSGFDSSH
jgi:hypothetical protein